MLLLTTCMGIYTSPFLSLFHYGHFVTVLSGHFVTVLSDHFVTVLSGHFVTILSGHFVTVTL